MTRQILCAALAIGAMTYGTFAQRLPNPAGQNPNLPRELQQGVQREFPGGKVKVERESTVNGVRLFELRVTPANGQSLLTTMTQFGETIDLSQEANANPATIPPSAREVVTEIWRTPPSEVRPVMGRFFWVTIGAPGANTAGLAAAAGSHIYELRFDATGQLLDLKSPTQLHHGNWQAFGDAPANLRTKLEQIVARRYPQARIAAAKELPGAMDMYEVRFTINGADGWVDCDANGDVASEATTIAVNELPQPVQKTINATFRGDRVVWAARNDIRFYEFREDVGNEAVTLRVQPDGEVLSLRTARESGAIPASLRQRGK